MRRISNIKIILILIIFIALISNIFLYMNNRIKYKEIPYKLFLEHIEGDLVQEVELKDKSQLRGKLKNGALFITDNPRREDFKEYLLLHNIDVVENKSLIPVQIITVILLLLGVGILAYFTNQNYTKQAEKEMALMSEIHTENSANGKITFEDVAGNQEAKESLKELVDFIQYPEIYSKYGARLPRGVLLYGPPGTGKTLLAKALAGEANVPFYPVSGSDFIQVYAGLGASRIRELFKKAKEDGKSVIFIDEIDALGKKRKGSNSNSSEEGDRTLNALLTEMSGFKGNEGIIVIAATNRIDTLDEALLRPGRFDRQIEIGLPDVNARYSILELHSKNKPLSPEVDLKKLATETVYFSGAKLENLMNESAIIAARDKDKNINNKHIDRAYYKVLVGDEKKDRNSISLEDREITAYHEAGHALIAKKVNKNNRVTKVSIIPSTKGMGGFSLNIPKDKMYQTKMDIINNIKIALAGRAAEEIIFGKDNITTGASSDLQKATEMVLALLGSYGMDEEVGLINYDIILNSNLNIDISLMERARKILDDFYKDTIEILVENKIYLERIAEALLEKENLKENEIDKIFIA
ncbi:MAG: ATP-dependent zinc metalloprotease FtsH [Tissierellia bacterium]|nr:ATP-dependent zinc metalloprotease FtsH [Tissierellia bacterium]